MDELEQSGQDVSVSSGESSAPAESNSSQSSSESNQSLSSGQDNKQDKYVPYDRFKELVEQKNQFSKRFEDTDKALKELQSKLAEREKTSQAPKAPDEPEFVKWAKSKGLEPEFLKWVESKEKETSELRAWKEQAETWRREEAQRSYLTSAKATVESLKSELKVDPVLHNAYLAQIQSGLPVDQISAKYKELHTTMSKFLEGRERAKLTEYSKAKTIDSKVPSPKKGETPKAAPAKEKFSKDPEQARVQFRDALLKDMRSAKDI